VPLPERLLLSRGLRDMRAARLLAFAFTVGCAAVAAADTIPMPEAAGPGCWRWEYPTGQTIPENAKVVPGTCPTPDGRCYLVPSSACLEVHGVASPLFTEHPGSIPPPPTIPFPPPGPPAATRPPMRQRPIPPNGKAEDPLPAPGEGGECADGQGWDFETFLDNWIFGLRGYASLQGWRGEGHPGSPFVGLDNVDATLLPAPVYGNAIPIERIRPPGFQFTTAMEVGGDYWRHSQDINQHGDFWIGSLDRRYSWKHHPGDTWGDEARGTLTSPPCRLAARYLAFRLGGAAHGSQRVEVQVRGAQPRQYFGVLMLGGLGDGAFQGQKGYATQFASPSAPQDFPPPVDQDGWTTVRSAMPDSGLDSDWMQVFAFDLAPFAGKFVRIRVVDDRRQECTWGSVRFPVCLQRPEHLQADDFRFLDEPPAGTVWYRHTNDRCGGVAEAGEGCSPIGRVPSSPPLWGVTDVHAHPMANVGFGGHVIWGDAADELDHVYDCSQPLPAIPGPGGRPGINPTANKMTCFLSGTIAGLATGILEAGCSLLPAPPVVGIGYRAICKVVVAAASAALHNVPIAAGATLHGAAKISSGAFKYGAIFSGIHEALGDAELGFETGLIPQTDSMRKATGNEAGGWWKKDEAWHDPTGLNRIHNAYQHEMVRRAYQGGLRLAVWDVVNSRAFALVADGEVFSDWTALLKETEAARRIVATRLSDIAAIVLTPDEAEAVIRSNRMAIILGSEVDELGRPRPQGLPWPRSPHSGPDSMQKQVDDLWELGIRKITPVHAVNNPIGGTALFSTAYDANNYFLSGTPVDGPLTLVDLPAIPVSLDGSFGPLFDGLPLGLFNLIHYPAQASAPPWNPEDWFDFDTSLNPDDPLIGGTADVTYRIGGDGFKGTNLKGPDLKWLPPSAVLDKQVPLVRLVKMASLAASGPTCDLHNSTWPDFVDSFGPTVDKHYQDVAGHRNALGLFRAEGEEDGEGFLRAAMKKGMLIDTDHFSQKLRVDFYRLAESYAQEAGWPAGRCRKEPGVGMVCGDYPSVGVHSKVRGLEIEPSWMEHVKSRYGINDEASRTPSEVRHVAEQGGAFGLFPTGSAIIPPSTGGCTRNSDCASYKGGGASVCSHVGRCQDVSLSLVPRDYDLPAEVANDCDSSSKTFAVKYLWLLRATRGRGLTPATDLNGIMSTLNPRYGESSFWRPACGGNGRDGSAQGAPPAGWHSIMKYAQRYEVSGVWYDDYESRSPTPAAPGGTPRYKQVVARGAQDSREDRAPRYAQDDIVYFNDFGPDPAGMRGHTYQEGNRPGAQLYPMKRWRKIPGRAGWDFNLDGLQHIGLFPDLLQDMRNVGVQWEQMGPLFHSARDYIGTWRKGVTIGNAHP
jgi:hypothetical protein